MPELPPVMSAVFPLSMVVDMTISWFNAGSNRNSSADFRSRIIDVESFDLVDSLPSARKCEDELFAPSPRQTPGAVISPRQLLPWNFRQIGLQVMTRQLSSGNQSMAWSDELFEATEFLFADYRDFAFPLHVHETFAIGVIEVRWTALSAGAITISGDARGDTVRNQSRCRAWGAGQQPSAVGGIECSIRLRACCERTGRAAPPCLQRRVGPWTTRHR